MKWMSQFTWSNYYLLGEKLQINLGLLPVIGFYLQVNLNLFCFYKDGGAG